MIVSPGGVRLFYQVGVVHSDSFVPQRGMSIVVIFSYELIKSTLLVCTVQQCGSCERIITMLFFYRFHFQGKCGEILPEAVKRHPSEPEPTESEPTTD